jgi:hypothetical protein
VTITLKYWRLSDALTIFQAAMLITGHDPEHFTSANLQHWTSVPEGYGAAKNALIVAVRNGSLKGRIVGEQGFDEIDEPMGEIPGTVDIDATYIEVPSLIEYLKMRNFDSEVFGSLAVDKPNYMNSSSPYFAPKLAAAVDAWLYVSSHTNELSVGTPKSRIEKWLREHAVSYGLTKPDGSANEEAIQQISKIANWRPEGGASKTPARHTRKGAGSAAPSTPSLQSARIPKKGEVGF